MENKEKLSASKFGLEVEQSEKTFYKSVRVAVQVYTLGLQH